MAPVTYAAVTSSPAGTDQRAGAVACVLITVELASTAIQLASPGSTSGATSHGTANAAAVVSATSPATSGPSMPCRNARHAYQTDQAVSTTTAGISSATRTGGVRTDSATTAPTRPQVSRRTAGKRREDEGERLARRTGRGRPGQGHGGSDRHRGDVLPAATRPGPHGID